MGERTPHLDADARGAFVGLSGIHGHADLIRSVLEGVAFSLADGMDIIRSCGVSVQALMACGGGGSSPMWRQLHRGRGLWRGIARRRGRGRVCQRARGLRRDHPAHRPPGARPGPPRGL